MRGAVRVSNSDGKTGTHSRGPCCSPHTHSHTHLQVRWLSSAKPSVLLRVRESERKAGCQGNIGHGVGHGVVHGGGGCQRSLPSSSICTVCNLASSLPSSSSSPHTALTALAATPGPDATSRDSERDSAPPWSL